MTVRVEVVTPCEHDQWNPHRSGDGEIVASSDGAEIMAVICRGASRKAFTEWPPEAIEAAQTEMQGWVGYMIESGDPETIVDIVAGVLWGHITGKDET